MCTGWGGIAGDMQVTAAKTGALGKVLTGGVGYSCSLCTADPSTGGIRSKAPQGATKGHAPSV